MPAEGRAVRPGALGGHVARGHACPIARRFAYACVGGLLSAGAPAGLLGMKWARNRGRLDSKSLGTALRELASSDAAGLIYCRTFHRGRVRGLRLRPRASGRPTGCPVRNRCSHRPLERAGPVQSTRAGTRTVATIPRTARASARRPGWPQRNQRPVWPRRRRRSAPSPGHRDPLPAARNGYRCTLGWR